MSEQLAVLGLHEAKSLNMGKSRLAIKHGSTLPSFLNLELMFSLVNHRMIDHPKSGIVTF